MCDCCPGGASVKRAILGMRVSVRLRFLIWFLSFLSVGVKFMRGSVLLVVLRVKRFVIGLRSLL